MPKIKKVLTPLLLSAAIVGSSTLGVIADTKDILKLDMDSAVVTGIENSILLEQVLKEIDLSEVSQKRASFSARKLDRGRRNLKDAKEELNLKQREFDQIKDTLPPDVAAQMENQLNIAKNQINQGDYKITDALQEAGATISDQLNFASLDSLSIDATKDLLTTMADVSFEVTQASYDIFKNNIAMLIQKSYYDVLQAEKMIEVKARTMERGKKQFQLTSAGYREGMKSKDDMLLASIYYRGTQIEYEKSKGDYENSILELKKNMNIPLDEEIQLTGVLAEDIKDFNLDEGLLSGLKNRLEIKESLGQALVYDLNFTETKKKYPDNTFQYKESKLLKEKSKLNFDQTKVEVESSIRQSHNTLKTLSSMLASTKEMVEETKENLRIAELKYKEGFGVETSLLAKLDLQDSAGTIVEVLAAEENLAQIEEKIVHITYGYNLAQMKYFNDIGHFIY